jgi:acetyl-CoA synthetase
MKRSGLVKDIVLRRASSAGEPPTPDVVGWAKEALGVEVRDHYGQTEFGMVICNRWKPEVARPVRDGFMGRPMPGYAAGVLDGKIAIDVPGSPLMWFTGYHDDAGKTAERFTADGRWYLTSRYRPDRPGRPLLLHRPGRRRHPRRRVPHRAVRRGEC